MRTLIFAGLSVFLLHGHVLAQSNSGNISDSATNWGPNWGPNWGIGPIELGDQYPLALRHLSLRPTSPETLSSGETEMRSGFSWTNTLNYESDQLLVDAESRVLEIGVRHGIGHKVEISSRLPVVWQGSGELDSLIDAWHRFFGLPDGARDEIANGGYALSGVNSEGTGFDVSTEGVGIGDLAFGAKYLVSAGNETLPAISATAEILLPTGKSGFGQDAVDFSFGLLGSKRFGQGVVYAGMNYLIFADPDYQELEYEVHHFATFLAGEYSLIDSLSLQLAMTISSALLENVPEAADYSLYFDMGGKWRTSEGIVVEVLVRENPAPSDLTADVSFLLATSYRFQ